MCIQFFAAKKHEKITSARDHMTKRKRRENLCDMWQRLTKLNECDASGRVRENDGQQFLEKLL